MSDVNKPEFLRRIRSFVKREGRLTPGQQNAINTGWPLFGLNNQALIEPSQLFNNDNPITLEIGFGNGESLAKMASNSPQQNFIGIEVHRPGVGHLLRLIQEQQISNIRLFDSDAIDILHHCIPDNSLACVQLFFPDPWHKKRHHKRRIVSPDFLNLIHKKLSADGSLHVATDWENYAEHIIDELNHHKGFINTNRTTLNERPKHRPITKFERRGKGLGHNVWDIIANKIL